MAKKNFIFIFIFIVFIFFAQIFGNATVSSNCTDNDSADNDSTTGNSSLSSTSHSNICCGICKKDPSGLSAVWPNSINFYAHKECVDLIKKSQQNSKKNIKKHFKGDIYCLLISYKDIATIVEDLIAQNGEFSIKSYYEKFGEKKLSNLFDIATKEVLEELNRP